jgi:hypothetical protein
MACKVLYYRTALCAWKYTANYIYVRIPVFIIVTGQKTKLMLLHMLENFTMFCIQHHFITCTVLESSSFHIIMYKGRVIMTARILTILAFRYRGLAKSVSTMLREQQDLSAAQKWHVLISLLETKMVVTMLMHKGDMEGNSVQFILWHFNEVMSCWPRYILSKSYF